MHNKEERELLIKIVFEKEKYKKKRLWGLKEEE